MVLLDYECLECKVMTEELVKHGEEVKCPQCGKPMKPLEVQQPGTDVWKCYSGTASCKKKRTNGGCRK